MDTISFEWNTHIISGKKNSVAPNGRPVTMFELPEIYGTKTYINPVSENDIRNLDVFELCTIIMNKKRTNFY